MDRLFDTLSANIIKLSRLQKFSILLAIDVLLVPVAFWASVLLFSDALFPALLSSISLSLVFVLTLVLASAAAALSTLLGLPRIKLNAYEQSGILRTAVFSVGVGIVGLIALRLLIAGPQLAPSMVVFTMILLILAVGTRIAMRITLVRMYQRGRRRQRVLIYGAGQTGVQLASALGRDDAVVPVAFVDDNPTLNRMMVAGLPVFTPIRVEALIEEYAIDRVVLAMPSINRPKQARIARRMEEFGCDVSVVPSFATLVGENDLLAGIRSANPSEFLNREDLDCELNGVCDAYTDRSVMITGAGGSIGAELTRQIMACAPKTLVLYEVSEIALYQLSRELDELSVGAETEIITVLGSIMDGQAVARTLAAHKIEIVLHAAAYKHVNIVEGNVLAGMRNNVIGTKVLAEEARKAGVARFILISTDKAVRPTSIMGASTRLAEMVVQDLASKSGDTRFSLVRFGNVLGSSGSVVPLFDEQIARGGPITLTHPDVTRYFMTLSEAAQLVLLAGNYTSGGDIFVLDMGTPVPIRKLAEQMIEAAGYSVRDGANPDGDIEISIVGLTPGEKLHEELVTPDSTIERTAHPKISRVGERVFSQIEMASAMKALYVALENGSEDAARDVVRRWVGEYHADGTTSHAAETPSASI
jgi:FlaA1/EpsC-like NDP-sugar epimerase